MLRKWMTLAGMMTAMALLTAGLSAASPDEGELEKLMEKVGRQEQRHPEGDPDRRRLQEGPVQDPRLLRRADRAGQAGEGEQGVVREAEKALRRVDQALRRLRQEDRGLQGGRRQEHHDPGAGEEGVQLRQGELHRLPQRLQGRRVTSTVTVPAGEASAPGEVDFPGLRPLDHTRPTIEEDLALDEALLIAAEEGALGPVLRLWEPRRLAVVLGASGRRLDDVDVDRCRLDGVTIARRSSGGGTVLVGPGALNVTLVLPAGAAPGLSAVDAAQAFVLERTARSLRASGPPVEVRGSGGPDPRRPEVRRQRPATTPPVLPGPRHHPLRPSGRHRRPLPAPAPPTA